MSAREAWMHRAEVAVGPAVADGFHDAAMTRSRIGP